MKVRGARDISEVLGLWNGDVNEASPQFDGLVAFWPTAGIHRSSTVFDKMDWMNKATLYDGAVMSSVMGGSMRFIDGNDDRAECRGVSRAGKLTTLTFSAWIVPTTLGVTPVRFISTIRAGGNNGWTVGTDNTGKLEIVAWAVAGVTSTITLSTNTVQHIAVSCSSSETKFYHNGLLLYTGAGASITQNTEDPIYFGCDKFGGGPIECYQGYIANPCVWGRVLSADEVWNLYDPRTRYDLFGVPVWRGRKAAAAAPASYAFPVVSGRSKHIFRRAAPVAGVSV